MKYKDSLSSRLFDLFNVILMLAILLVTLYPLVYMLSKSLSSAEYVKANMVYVYPRGFNISAYKEVFANKLFLNAYKNTFIYTAVGTLINISMTAALAYCLSRPNLVFKKQITVLIVFTMFFGGGLVPNFLLVKWLKLYNTLWAIILPGAISTYNMIIVRTYMQSLPEEVIESVRVDGGNDLQIFWKIVIPLSKPTLATVGLFYAVGHWNSYFNSMIYFKDKMKYPVQLILKEMIVEQDLQGMASGAFDVISQQPPTSEMIVAASIIVTLIPVLIAYPFVQKFFVKGIMLGSVKG